MASVESDRALWFCGVCAIVLTLSHALRYLVTTTDTFPTDCGLLANKWNEDVAGLSSVSVQSDSEGRASPPERLILAVAILTAPRPRGATHLLNTVQSLVSQWPERPDEPLYDRLRIVVVNHFGKEHVVFSASKLLLEAADQLRHYVRFIDRDVPVQHLDHVFHRQRTHALSALWEAAKLEAEYTMLIEDDFPLCPYAWPRLFSLLCHCSDQRTGRGGFVATGGSGILLRRAAVPGALDRLNLTTVWNSQEWRGQVDRCLRQMEASKKFKESTEKWEEMPEWCETNIKHDVILHKYLLEEPVVCIPSSLLLRHTGYASSTVEGNGDAATKPDWQCGWRHPFTTKEEAVILV
eukprot:TRINITY_DN3130_c0_g1_i1.p1 TRINITY_DN3130_c0_g1~~TRINITY_DN3130_c0_g1_i1.p1  ORF type:complete len:351 (-),score=47.25 TRINITY_DN3130_c0_g1_i1:44-1096(-)